MRGVVLGFRWILESPLHAMAQATPLEASDRRTRLRQELERIRQVLSTEPTVLQLRVFGSVATGRVHEWSDRDLFVVMRSSEPFVSRSARLALTRAVATCLP